MTFRRVASISPLAAIIGAPGNRVGLEASAQGRQFLPHLFFLCSGSIRCNCPNESLKAPMHTAIRATQDALLRRSRRNESGLLARRKPPHHGTSGTPIPGQAVAARNSRSLAAQNLSVSAKFAARRAVKRNMGGRQKRKHVITSKVAEIYDAFALTRNQIGVVLKIRQLRGCRLKGDLIPAISHPRKTQRLTFRYVVSLRTSAEIKRAVRWQRSAAPATEERLRYG